VFAFSDTDIGGVGCAFYTSGYGWERTSRSLILCLHDMECLCNNDCRRDFRDIHVRALTTEIMEITPLTSCEILNCDSFNCKPRALDLEDIALIIRVVECILTKYIKVQTPLPV
jgi:hypothetical protein